MPLLIVSVVEVQECIHFWESGDVHLGDSCLIGVGVATIAVELQDGVHLWESRLRFYALLETCA